MGGVFGFFLLSFFSCTALALSLDPHFIACEPLHCGNGLNISYPFRLPDQPSYCGHPGFELVCKNLAPVLEMPNNDQYYIQNISYVDHHLLVVNDRVFSKESCPWPTHNVTFQRTPFVGSSQNVALFFYFHCADALPERIGFYPVHNISCLSNASHQSYTTFADPQLLDPFSYVDDCMSWAYEPVLTEDDEKVNFEISDYKQILKMGFFMEWKADNCTKCVQSGGRCGFYNNTSGSICFCPDGWELVTYTAEDIKVFVKKTKKQSTYFQEIANFFSRDECLPNKSEEARHFASSINIHSSAMASSSTLSFLLSFFLLSHLSFNSPEPAESGPLPNCPHLQCKEAGETRLMHGFSCGVFEYNNCAEGIPSIQFEEGGRWYAVKNISEEEKTLFIQDAELTNDHDLCTALPNFARGPHVQPKYLEVASQKATFFRCKRHDEIPEDCGRQSFNYTRCTNHVLYYFPKNKSPSCSMDNCDGIEIPMQELPTPSSPNRLDDNLVSLLDKGFALRWKTSGCFECHKDQYQISTPPPTSSRGVGAALGSCIGTCLLFVICFYYRKRRFSTAPALLSRGMSSDPSSRSELGKEGVILPTHIFTYEELEDATNNFDPSKELGDGGFGTVYHGKIIPSVQHSVVFIWWL
ncbi:hypothetical protein ACLOJK_033066 [Asimina triloba]